MYSEPKIAGYAVEQQRAGQCGAALGGAITAMEQLRGNDRGQLESASDAIANAVSELDAALNALEGRLAFVLQPSVPSPTGSGCDGAMPPVSPAVGYLIEQRRRLDAAVMRINEMRSRLDT